MQFENTIEFARAADAADSLKNFRQQFIIPVIDGKEQVYFLGNSLGLQPKATAAALQEVLTQWATYGVEGFFMGNKPWMDYHDSLTPALAKIVGALPHEISVMNQLTVNLHLMMVSFYRPMGKRNKIICEAKAFPSDQYMFETHIKHYGFSPEDILIEVAPRAGEHTIRTEDILAAIEIHKDDLALVLWGGLNYYTGQVFDIAAITHAAHAAGALAGFDLAHATGNIELQLHQWNVDFACWCSYKYLNSGPGAVGGVYIHERFHNDSSLQRYAGWWGYDKATRFKMEKGFIPINTAEGWQLSTPSILLYAAHKAALDIFEQASMPALHSKRLQLSNYAWWLLQQLPIKNFTILTPDNTAERGCQISLLMHRNGKAVYDALMQDGFITDWREPDVIRFAPVPLYNTYEEVFCFVNKLEQLLSA